MRSKMKVLGLTALVGLAGCADLDEEIVTGVTGSFFATPEGADAAITGTYARLRNWIGQERETKLWMIGTDSWEKGADSGADAPFNDYTGALAPNMSNTALRDHWQNLYQAVNAANTAIHYIGSSTEIPENTKAVRLGEARFLRALFYHELVRTWGDVHLTLEPTEGVVVTASRTPAEDIYNQAIIPDLEFAIANLPATQPQWGRATEGAAQTLLAEVYLTRGTEGDLDRARDLTTTIINSGTYELNPSFYGLFCGARFSEACEFLPANETNPEFIFSVQFTGDGAQDPWGQQFHLYWTTPYDLQAFAEPSLARRLEYGRPFKRVKPTPHLLNIWNRETDSRYDANFQTLWKHPSGDTATFFPGTETVSPEYQNKPYKAFGQSEYGPFLFPTLRKWLDDKRSSPQTFEGGRDRHLWRLADVYLMRAEANIRAGRVAEAVPDFNMLRRRGAKPGMEAANELGAAEMAQLNAEAIDFLLDERERELAGEEMRYYVLTRLGKLVDRVQAYNAAGAPNVMSYHALRPIPQEQIDRTEGGETAFPQNPGY